MTEFWLWVVWGPLANEVIILNVNSFFETILLIISVGLVAGKIAQKLKMPDIIFFILAGIIISPAGFGWADIPVGSTTSDLILTFGAAYILFDGGVSLNLKGIRRTWLTILLLATLGLLMTTFITGLAVHLLFRIPLIIALLVAAVISSTDPATIIPIFKQCHIKKKLAETIVSESAFNDAIGAILTFSLLAVITTGKISVAQSMTSFILNAGGGIFTGVIIGFFFGFLISEHRLGFLDEFSPVVTLIIVISAYVFSNYIHGSGFMAVFVAGLIIGNMDDFKLSVAMHYKRRMHHFLDTVSLLMRLMVFVLLGLQIKFDMLGKYFWPALAVVAVFIFVARPLAVLVSSSFDRRAKWTRPELIFMCWSRETGVIPAALAGLIMRENIPAKGVIAAVTVLAVLTTILLQGSTASRLAKTLGLTEK